MFSEMYIADKYETFEHGFRCTYIYTSLTESFSTVVVELGFQCAYLRTRSTCTCI